MAIARRGLKVIIMGQASAVGQTSIEDNLLYTIKDDRLNPVTDMLTIFVYHLQKFRQRVQRPVDDSLATCSRSTFCRLYVNWHSVRVSTFLILCGFSSYRKGDMPNCRFYRCTRSCDLDHALATVSAPCTKDEVL